MASVSYVYRFLSNFLFLGIVYVSLNYLDRYAQRSIVAAMILGYVMMRTISVLRSFYFLHQIEKLEGEVRNLRAAAKSARSATEKDVSQLRWQGEVKSYIELLFLCLVVVLCLAKIFTE